MLRAWSSLTLSPSICNPSLAGTLDGIQCHPQLEGPHWKTLLMSLSLLHQQCPAYLVYFSYIVYEIGEAVCAAVLLNGSTICQDFNKVLGKNAS